MNTETFTRTIAVKDYMKRFRDAERFIGLCRQCGNYGKRWGCPPFDHDPTDRLGRYSTAEIIVTTIHPDRSGIPISEGAKIMRPVRERLERELLAREALTGGLAFTFVGECLNCPSGSCTRPQGLPCRHPDKVRPSLEAYGFDLGRTLKELFGMELLWGTDGTLPRYLTLVCALFH